MQKTPGGGWLSSLAWTLCMVAIAGSGAPRNVFSLPAMDVENPGVGRSAQPGGLSLLWPVQVRPAVSSNFCEYREGHLHAGVDIRTFGREGVACVAAADGEVTRIRAAAHAYGKALYVRLETGQTLVYAHLAEFAPDLEVALRQAQERAGRYRIDMRTAPGTFPVRRGDVIAWSGRTGATAPHLHFEIRDRNENPVDPLVHGLDVADTTAPEFVAVRFLPLSADARIDGACFPRRIAAMGRANVWTLAEPIDISGPVGIAVDVFDRLNRDSGRLAPRVLELSVDRRSLARVEMDRFSFAHAAEVDFLYDMAAVRSQKRAFYFLLFEHPGESLWNRQFENRGVLDPDGGAGPAEAVVEARDAAGNVSRLTFTVRRRAAAKGDAASPWPDEPESAGLYAYRGLLSARNVPGVLSLSTWPDLEKALPGGPGIRVFTVSQIGPAPLALPVGVGADAPRVYAAGLRAGQARSIRFGPLESELIVGAGSLWADEVVWLRGMEARPESGRGASELVHRADPVEFGPASLSLRADVELRFTSGRWDSLDAIYRAGRDGWSYYASRRDHGVLSTTCKRPGVYAVFADRTPPAVRRPVVRRRARYSGEGPEHELVVPVDDTGSGVDDERTTIVVAGRARIARWDFVSRKFFVALGDTNIIGLRNVHVTAFDQAGNRAVFEAPVRFPSVR